ncbi:MAG TPA: YdeI/OmpD-associated family protein [Candidatus Saccharimonadales bacterium]|nr:YdeI/OmpD-associated family protein [Candidatus Saccharimonadales bacterium]
MAKVYKNPGPLKFTAIIKRGGELNSSEYVEFPYDLKETFGVGNLVPYTVTFDGRVKYRGSLAKMGGPCAMILLRKDIRAELEKCEGEAVDVIVELDDKPREVSVPAELKRALRESGQLENFESLSYTNRKEYARWVVEAKKPETRLIRIEKTCTMLAAGVKTPR